MKNQMSISLSELSLPMNIKSKILNFPLKLNKILPLPLALQSLTLNEVSQEISNYDKAAILFNPLGDEEQSVQIIESMGQLPSVLGLLKDYERESALKVEGLQKGLESMSRVKETEGRNEEGCGQEVRFGCRGDC
mmetsp:Transcript_12750/g.11306  ORF Transcript_12750/g.11306 Transcript_12750/m.11306 type:complete len:135 (+) Transcript_12750:568-972(+)